MTLITKSVQAYVNYGRWVADCPRPYCGNAIELKPRQGIFECVGKGSCGMVASVEWPGNAQEIWDALSKRPVPSTRNWQPAGHRYGDMGYVCGQTPQELLEEQELMERLAEEG